MFVPKDVVQCFPLFLAQASAERGAHFSVAMPEFGAGDMGDTIIIERDGLGTPVPERLLALKEQAFKDLERSTMEGLL